MTPAIELLKKHNISYKVLPYEHNPHVNSYGLEAVEKLEVDAEKVFKTLLVISDKHELLVGVVPVLKHLDLKAIAHVAEVKKVEMAKPDMAQKVTGYLVGGISPLGQKKKLRTFIDESASAQDIMYVSGGRRGLDIALAPQDLAKILDASFVAIAKE